MSETRVKKLTYLKDSALEDFKQNFQMRYYPLYKLGKAEELTKSVCSDNNVVETDIEYEYISLKLESAEYMQAIPNSSHIMFNYFCIILCTL